MSDIKVPENIQKIDRTEWVDFLNVTPKEETQKWAVIGVGISDLTTDYNSDVSEEKWIIYKNAVKSVNGYSLSSGVEQTAYKGDPVFDFVDDIRYRLKTGTDAETDLLEIDKYSVTDVESSPKYRARLWKVAISITSNKGEEAKVNYTYNYKGDPTFGTVTFADGVPTFKEESAE